MFTALQVLGLAFIICGCREPVLPPAYLLSPPTLPPVWEAVLGPPRWRLEWFDRDGIPRSFEGSASAFPGIELSAEWAAPVLAYPFWSGYEPGQGIPPGTMRPAGALAPFDVEGGSLRLTWEAGPDAYFYRAQAAALKALEAAVTGTAAGKRRPEFFDWPRFRELMKSPNIPPEVRADPWRVDWDSLAARTIQSGFDRRRIQAQSRLPAEALIPCPGPWLGSSPFEEAHYWEAGEKVTLEAGETVEACVSPEGILKFSQKGVLWAPGGGK